jgi:hypothetical protein
MRFEATILCAILATAGFAQQPPTPAAQHRSARLKLKRMAFQPS